MYSGQLAVVVGYKVNEPLSVLWSSPAPPRIVPGRNDGDQFRIEYYASLDDDGSLTVYRRRRYSEADEYDEPNAETTSPFDPIHPTHWWSHILQWAAQASSVPTQTRAAAAWKAIQRWAATTLTGKPSTTSSSKSTHQRNSFKLPHIDECVFASGPAAGCLTPG